MQHPWIECSVGRAIPRSVTKGTKEVYTIRKLRSPPPWLVRCLHPLWGRQRRGVAPLANKTLTRRVAKVDQPSIRKGRVARKGAASLTEGKTCMGLHGRAAYRDLERRADLRNLSIGGYLHTTGTKTALTIAIRDGPYQRSGVRLRRERRRTYDGSYAEARGSRIAPRLNIRSRVTAGRCLQAEVFVRDMPNLLSTGREVDLNGWKQ